MKDEFGNVIALIDRAVSDGLARNLADYSAQDIENTVAAFAAAPIITAEAMGRLNYELVSSRVCDLMGFKQAVHPWDALTPEHRQAWIDSALKVLEAGR